MDNIPTLPKIGIVGKGSPNLELSAEELRVILDKALLPITAGARVLAIISDKTRDDNTGVLFPAAAEILAARRVGKFDALVAQGTHMPMSLEDKKSKIGMQNGTVVPGLGNIYDHKWNEPEELVTIGELTAERVNVLTGGLLNHAVSVNLNRLLAQGIYDLVLVFGATVPTRSLALRAARSISSLVSQDLI